MTYDDFAFALPANAGAIYRPRKEAAATAHLGDAAHDLGRRMMAARRREDSPTTRPGGRPSRSTTAPSWSRPARAPARLRSWPGRIAMLLAEGGAQPKSIAAVTFTEFAASELLIRVRAFVGALAAGDIPTELRVALPKGLSDEQRRNLAAADAALDEMTCSTIHGFCQRLITPYPVEADIDPGAGVMDRDQADLVFAELIDAWLREELAGEADGLLAELVLHDPAATLGLIRTVLDHLRRHRAFAPYERKDLAQLATAFREAAEAFNDFLDGEDAEEPETTAIAGHFHDLAEEIAAAMPADTPGRLVRLLVTMPHDDLLNKDGEFYAYRKKGKWEAAAKRAGLAKADGGRLNDAARTHYAFCCTTWTALQGPWPPTCSRISCPWSNPSWRASGSTSARRHCWISTT